MQSESYNLGHKSLGHLIDKIPTSNKFFKAEFIIQFPRASSLPPFPAGGRGRLPFERCWDACLCNFSDRLNCCSYFMQNGPSLQETFDFTRDGVKASLSKMTGLYCMQRAR